MLNRISTAAHKSYVVGQDSGAFAGSSGTAQPSTIRSNVGAVSNNPGQIAEGIQLCFLGRLNQAVNHRTDLGANRQFALDIPFAKFGKVSASIVKIGIAPFGLAMSPRWCRQ